MTILTQQLAWALVRQKVVQCVSIEGKVYRIYNVKEVGQAGYKGVDLGDLGHSQPVPHTEENSSFLQISRYSLSSFKWVDDIACIILELANEK